MPKKSRTSIGSESAPEAQGPRILIEIKLYKVGPLLRSTLEIQRGKVYGEGSKPAPERTGGSGVSTNNLCGLIGLPEGSSSSAGAS